MTKAKISRESFLDYIHEDRDLLENIQDTISDSLYLTGKCTLTLDDLISDYTPFIPTRLIENLDEVKEVYPDRIDDDCFFIFDSTKDIEYINFDVEWIVNK